MSGLATILSSTWVPLLANVCIVTGVGDESVPDDDAESELEEGPEDDPDFKGLVDSSESKSEESYNHWVHDVEELERAEFDAFLFIVRPRSMPASHRPRMIV